ncbi:YscO family type III secretion system apparatus protein [Endozoicomonas sp. SCSIO W0465]|uniref:type III secretion system stalk subunit SctO n=1 Tax=Endozoicomonas sp. SCSIO W0465 TaxID=2918516 RepID=UPI00207572DA|nr:YscO family type III secretion system apparatus protein [Endozoicomonas sp. SCSIO W0465]USE34674.1 type III secretion protein [Endozoicomonas sp. SCSIO W0465]
MLHDLLKVKNIREQSAEREVKRCQHELDLAHQEVERRKQEVVQRQQELEEYIVWRSQEEQRLYDNIMNTSIQQHDLDRLKQKVAMLREKDASLEQAIADAEHRVVEAQQQVTEAEQVLEAAKQAHYKAKLAVEKFEEFCKVQDEEAEKEAKRLEDLEMEEFTVKSKE